MRKAAGRQQSENQKKLTEKQVLVRELEAIVKEQEEIGPGTGVERATRWTGRNPAAGGRGRNHVNGKVSAVPAAGNAANAAAAATASAGIVSRYSYANESQIETTY